ncbi:hypothetical protein BLA29_000528 [Euroglyphus maynei]|uniref:Uncharacterized protein n=1 Tax=Euroglyphus maynei TaxID=6958 RepID=A0A1Y3BKE6_EURMA|nr:hypothetical protein BLA29_000528 [Euroglyphus maynei]
MNSNQKSISKHRTGGGGGQSQSNQRGDYQRSNQDRYQSHASRSNNSNVSTHVGSVPMNIQSSQINATAINSAAAMQNSMGQLPLMRNYAPNQQSQPALIGHQPSNIQMSHLNQQQQQQQPTGAPTVVSSQQAMSGMIDAAAAAAAAQQQRFPSFSVQQAQSQQQQQQQRIPTNHQNSIRHSYNHPMRSGGGGSGGGNNSGTGSGGGHMPNPHHNNLPYAPIPNAAAAASIAAYAAAAQNQLYAYHPHHHHPGSFHHQNQFSMQNPVHQPMTYSCPAVYYKPPITTSSNNDTPKLEKNAQNTTNKTEINGLVKNEGTKSQNATATAGSSSDDKITDKPNNEAIGDDDSSSSTADSKPNESQKQQTTTTRPVSSESSIADGHPKSFCDMHSEATIPSTSTADLSSSISLIDPKQSTVNDDGQTIDEIAKKVDRMVLSNNDDHSTTSTMDGDFVKVTGDGDTVVDATAASAAVIDAKESLEIDSTTLSDENDKSSTATPVTTKNVEKSPTIHQTSTIKTGDMESSFEIIDHINTASETSTPNTTTSAAVEIPMVNHERSSRDGTPEPRANVESLKSKQKPATSVGNKDVTETTADNKSNVIDSRQYSRDALLQLRPNATELDLTHSNQDNVRDIIRKNNQNIPTDLLFPLYAQQNRPMNDNTLQYRNKSMVCIWIGF